MSHVNHSHLLAKISRGLISTSQLVQFFATNLGLHICIVVVLQQQGSCLCVIFARSDVKGRKADFPLGVIFKQQGNHLVVSLLKGYCQRGEAILSDKQ